MNKTNFEHAAYALLIQVILGIITGNFWLGAAAGIAFFAGREHAQREYKIGNPSTLKPWEGFDIWRWSTDAKLDLLFPIIASVALAAGIQLWSAL